MNTYGCWDGCGEEYLFSPFHESKVPGKQTHRISIVYLPGKVIFLEDFTVKSNMSKSKIPMNFSVENLESFRDFSYMAAQGSTHSFHPRLTFMAKLG